MILHIVSKNSHLGSFLRDHADGDRFIRRTSLSARSCRYGQNRSAGAEDREHSLSLTAVEHRGPTQKGPHVGPLPIERLLCLSCFASALRGRFDLEHRLVAFPAACVEAERARAASSFVAVVRGVERVLVDVV